MAEKGLTTRPSRMVRPAFLNQLAEAGLIAKDAEGWRANVDVLAAFLPPTGAADGD